MNQDDPDPLSALADVLETLPDDARQDVLAEIAAKVESLRLGALTPAQRAEVARRRAASRTYASPAEIEALLSRFDPPR